jgi:8-oxo-dGTP diphosphatase
MISKKEAESFFPRGLARHLPHLSVDCVVFGFHDGELKLLLLKWRNSKTWALPGGYVRSRESLDAAARRVLQSRTGLRRVYLQQFHAFGGLNRKEATLRRLFAKLNLATPADAWLFGRVVSIGYYALVDFSEVKPEVDYLSDTCTWHLVDHRPRLAFDHDAIVAKALEALRSSLDSATIGATLLPERFTMPELQRVHEAILGRQLDRRNFQKKMIERSLVERLPDRRPGGAHRAPFLYRFRHGEAHTRRT